MVNAPLVIFDGRSVMSGDLVKVDKVLSDKIDKAHYPNFKNLGSFLNFFSSARARAAIFKNLNFLITSLPLNIIF